MLLGFGKLQQIKFLIIPKDWPRGRYETEKVNFPEATDEANNSQFIAEQKEETEKLLPPRRNKNNSKNMRFRAKLCLDNGANDEEVLEGHQDQRDAGSQTKREHYKCNQ